MTQPTDVTLTDSGPQAADGAQAQGQSRAGLRHSSSSFPLVPRFCPERMRQEAKGRTFTSFLRGWLMKWLIRVPAWASSASGLGIRSF